MSIWSAPRDHSILPLAIGDFVMHRLSNAVGTIEKIVAAPFPVAWVRIPHWGVCTFPWSQLSKIHSGHGIMIRTERTLSSDGVEITRLVQSFVPALAATRMARYPPAQRKANGGPARC